MSLLRFERVAATFRPQRIDDLRPELKPWIGFCDVWYAAWTVESGPYEGQWAMMLEDTTATRNEAAWPCYWVPLCDLEAER